MTGPAFTFRRLGSSRPPAYAVESPSDYLGNVVAVDPGRPGQSRSTNRYRAYPVTRRGYAADPLPNTFGSRREAARAIHAYLQEQGR